MSEMSYSVCSCLQYFLLDCVCIGTMKQQVTTEKEAIQVDVSSSPKTSQYLNSTRSIENGIVGEGRSVRPLRSAACGLSPVTTEPSGEEEVPPRLPHYLHFVSCRSDGNVHPRNGDFVDVAAIE